MLKFPGDLPLPAHFPFSSGVQIQRLIEYYLRWNPASDFSASSPKETPRPALETQDKLACISQPSSRLLKKPSMTFSATPFEKCESRMAYIFNGLQPSKMVAHPVPHSRLGEKRAFSPCLLLL